MSQTQFRHADLPEKSALRIRLLDEAKAAARRVGERKGRARTWTKRPKYEGQQCTLDLQSGMSELRPSRKRKPDSQSLSPKDFTPAKPSPVSDGQDGSQWNAGDIQAIPEPVMDEYDEMVQRSRAQEPEPAHAWVQGAIGVFSPAVQSRPKLANSMRTDPAECGGRAKMQAASDPIMDELDEIIYRSRTQSFESTSAWFRGTDGVHLPCDQSGTELDGSMPFDHPNGESSPQLQAVSGLYVEDSNQNLVESGAQRPESAFAWPRGSNGVYYPYAQARSELCVSIPVDLRWPPMWIQPDSGPISQEQLAAEVKLIYAGLTKVESKCMQVDKAQAMVMRKSDAQISNDHWQALMALHKTLLHEHHDFFLASQHPNASPALKELAMKYSMPNRMWRNGVHSLLDLLSHKPKEHSEHMEEFLQTVHETMDMLQQNVPSMQVEWDKILDVLGTFEQKMFDQEEMWHLREQTSTLTDPCIEHDFEYGDIYNSTLVGPSHAHLDDDQLGGPWFPEHVMDILSAWLYLGSGICAHNFNIFVKTFTVIAIAAWPTQLMWPLI